MPTTLSRDHDFTDYDALKDFVLDFIRASPSGAGPNARRETTDG
jgi:hypothetical protein